MLQTIRERFTGPIAFAVIAAIGITLVISFGNMDTGGAGGDFAAEVNGEKIPITDYQRVLQNQMVRQQEIFQGELPPALEQQLQRNVLEGLVRNQVTAQYARDSGFRVSEGRLRNYIATLPVFQVGGEYSYESYIAVLSSQGLSPEGFERDQRSALEINQLETGIIESAFYTPAEYRRYIELLAERREASFVSFDPVSLSAQTDVNEEQLLAYYEANPIQFETEESVDLDYVEIRLSDISQAIRVDEAAIREFYDENPDRFRSSERRRSGHILISVDAGSDDAEALQLAEELAQRLAGGEEFAALAKQYSDDPVSGGEGGDLGWSGSGDFVPAFEEALFSLEAGETSDPVRTEFGYHLIRVEEVREGEQQTYADVRDDLLNELREGEASDQFFALAEMVDDLALENLNSLEPVADGAGLELKRVENFTRAGGGAFGYNQALIDAAFSAAVLEDRENSPLIEVSDNEAVVIRVTEHRPVSLQAFEEVRSSVEEIVRLELAAELALARGQEVIARLHGGEAVEDVASEYKFELTSPGPVDRGSDAVDAQLLAAIFRAPKPDGDRPVFEGVPLANGGFAIFRLDSVRPGIPEAIPQDQRDSRKQNLAMQLGRSSSAAIVTDLSGDASVFVAPGLFDQPDQF